MNFFFIFHVIFFFKRLKGPKTWNRRYIHLWIYFSSRKLLKVGKLHFRTRFVTMSDKSFTNFRNILYVVPSQNKKHCIRNHPNGRNNIIFKKFKRVKPFYVYFRFFPQIFLMKHLRRCWLFFVNSSKMLWIDKKNRKKYGKNKWRCQQGEDDTSRP